MFKKQLLALAFGACTATSAMAVPVHAGNGHWYEYIAGPATWAQAFAAANASTFLGMQGYLATITSAAENTFAAITVAGGALSWVGGSDDGNEGVWTWRNGPETGQLFTYTNWNGGEPNNAGIGEDFLHVNFGGPEGWNDHGAPNSGNLAHGYIVEYNGVPVPASMALVLAGLGLAGLARRRRTEK